MRAGAAGKRSVREQLARIGSERRWQVMGAGAAGKEMRAKQLALQSTRARAASKRWVLESLQAIRASEACKRWECEKLNNCNGWEQMQLLSHESSFFSNSEEVIKRYKSQ